MFCVLFLCSALIDCTSFPLVLLRGIRFGVSASSVLCCLVNFALDEPRFYLRNFRSEDSQKKGHKGGREKEKAIWRPAAKESRRRVGRKGAEEEGELLVN
ncbi:unnamed protein product [Sphagnum balticum]